MTRVALSVAMVLCGLVAASASAGSLCSAILFTAVPPTLVVARPSTSGAQAGPALPLDLGPEDRAYRELFTPSSSPPGTFAVYRSAEDVTSLAARLRALDRNPAAGAWDVEKTGVFDAFGAEGPYDKGRLARLFGGSSPRAARGSLVTPQGRVAVALISPYPDLAITSLLQGTLVIVTRLPREGEFSRSERCRGVRLTGRARSSPGNSFFNQREGTKATEGFVFNHRDRTSSPEDLVFKSQRPPTQSSRPCTRTLGQVAGGDFAVEDGGDDAKSRARVRRSGPSSQWSRPDAGLLLERRRSRVNAPVRTFCFLPNRRRLRTAFTISREDYEPQKQRLEALGLTVTTATHDWVHWRSIYVPDPEGNTVEFVCFDPEV